MVHEEINRACELARLDSKHDHTRLCRAVETLATIAANCLTKLNQSDYYDIPLLLGTFASVELAYNAAQQSYAIEGRLQSLAFKVSVD